MATTQDTGGARGTTGRPEGPDRQPRWVLLLALGAAGLGLLSNLGGIASGDDGVGYRAIADSILAGDGLRYFLEDPLTIWPPLWPALMAGLAEVTPLDTRGAAIVLNALTVVAAVLLGHRLLRRCVHDDRLVLLGTLVIGAGSSTMGFAHLLMTDFAFAVVVVAWMLTLMNFHDDGRARWLVAAGALVAAGFGLRYVAIYLLGVGGLWLLLDRRRAFTARLVSGISYGLVGVAVPVAWMLRNHATDGTWTGPRWPSARGPVDNAFDILSTMGRWLLPGVLNGAKYLWAAVGGVVLVTAVWLGWKVLAALPSRGEGDSMPRRLVAWVGRPTGLLALNAFGYLAYMLYVRTTTALNQLDVRLLNPAYLSLLALALVLVDRLVLLPPPGASPWVARGRAVAHAWAAANIAAGLVAVVMFATGDPFFDGNYESSTFRDVRANAALDAVPEGCRVYSNLPNGLYPRLEAQWSPRRTGLESDARDRDLEELEPTLDERPACLVWIDEPPDYGHLWSFEQLSEELELVPLAEEGNVAVYRIEPSPG